MSALINYCTNYVRKIWIKYCILVTSCVSSSASVVVREASIIVQYVQYSTIQCTVQ